MRYMMKCLGAMVCMLGMSMSSAYAQTGDAPEEVVKLAIDGIVSVLKAREDKSKVSAADRAAIRAKVDGRFDYREMARRSVGRGWKKQSEEKQQAFTHVFRDLLEYTYSNRLAAYRNQVIQYDKAEFKKNKARVKTQVVDDAKTTPVEYRLHQTKNGWMVYDIKIEGVSLVGTFRKDFKSTLRHQGFDALLDALKKKVKKMKQKAEG